MALRKLVQVDAAVALQDLRVPPGNRLEALTADRKGQFGIRINDQWPTTTRPKAAKVQDPVHPGEVLLNDFLSPLGLTQYRAAKGMGVPRRRLNEVVLGVRGITADTALRLARFFGTSEQFWLNLQNRYDLERERDRLGDRLNDVEVFAGVVGGT